MEILDHLTRENITAVIGLLMAIRGIGATIAIHTPNKTDDKFWVIVNGVLNTVGGNYGHSRNFEAVKASEE